MARTARAARTAWQVQEAKQRFSELVRRAEEDGPQTVTRHGKDVAVVIAAGKYERLARSKPGFKEFLKSMPELPEEILERQRDTPRRVSL
jgi:prevent-host-death family protein